MKKNMYLFLLLIIAGCLIFTGNNSAKATEMNYSVKAIIPENQINKNKTYFDLKMIPEQEQVISLELENSSNQEITLQIDVNTATTNRNGVINYGKSHTTKDDSLIYEISELITGEKEISLLPNEKKTVNYTIKMPEKKFDGMLLGGFYIHRKQTQEELKLEKDVQIKNDFSYVIGIKLIEEEKKIEPVLKLNNITPGLQNYRTIVNATLQNISPIIISGMTIEAEISKVGSSNIIHETKKSNQSMAPNSSYEFPISWDNKELNPGKYNLLLKANDDEGHVWNFNRDFEIKNNIKKLNEEAVGLDKEVNWIGYLLCIVIILVIIILYIIIKNKNKKKKYIKSSRK